MVREAEQKDKNIFNKVASHPMQSWEWGDFRKETGVKVTRLVEQVSGKILRTYQITWHGIPGTNFCIGYCPKSAVPSAEALNWVKEESSRRRAIFVKFEPNEKVGAHIPETLLPGKALFTKFTLTLDLTKPEDKLLKEMNQKTRYNIRLAIKKGVKIVEDKTENGFDDYWKLTLETTRRQNFYAHTQDYHRKMWKEMVRGGNAHLLKAVYGDKVLAVWVLFELNGVLYYPYGSSSSEHREVMASNLMMWEAIRLGKKLNCRLFDLWGSLGNNPDKDDKWYGFHKFKQGYGAELIEFVGSWDLVVNNFLYTVYTVVDWIRWKALRAWRT